MTRRPCLGDELDEDQGIAHHDAGQGNHADHRRRREQHRIRRAGDHPLPEMIHGPEAGHDADDRQRDRQHDDQRQGHGAGLHAQHHEDRQQREQVAEAHIPEHVEGDLQLALPGPDHLRARRKTPSRHRRRC
jgi:hypothetical protein